MTLEEYYKTVWGGAWSDDTPALLGRSRLLVENAVFMSGVNISTAPESVRNAFYNAVCAQADYISAAGGIDALSETGGASFSLGKFSYSESTGESVGAAYIRLCPQARAFLAPTGLLYKGVDVI